MAVWVQFKLPSGEVTTLSHGGLIGRLPTASLHIDDARVSEAHAMVSLRGRDARLLALRGRFSVGGKRLADVVLKPGMTIHLADGLALDVVDVELPERVFALSGTFGKRVLIGVTSVFERDGQVELKHGWRPEAALVFWPVGTDWRCTSGSVRAGDTWRVGDSEITAVTEASNGFLPTQQSAEFAAPLTLVVRFDTAHIQRDGEPTVVVQGKIARVLTELVQTSAPVDWEVLARGLWEDPDRAILRSRWDMLLLRFRQKLRRSGLRDDLLRPDGSGLIELVLGSNDRTIDES